MYILFVSDRNRVVATVLLTFRLQSDLASVQDFAPDDCGSSPAHFSTWPLHRTFFQTTWPQYKTLLQTTVARRPGLFTT